MRATFVWGSYSDILNSLARLRIAKCVCLFTKCCLHYLTVSHYLWHEDIKNMNWSLDFFVVSFFTFLRNFWTNKVLYLPPANEVWGKVIFSEACVKNSVQKGESASVHAGIPHPRPGTPPGSRRPPPDTPRAVHAGRYGQRAGGMHPTGMQSCQFSCVDFVGQMENNFWKVGSCWQQCT